MKYDVLVSRENDKPWQAKLYVYVEDTGFNAPVYIFNAQADSAEAAIDAVKRDAWQQCYDMARLLIPERML